MNKNDKYLIPELVNGFKAEIIRRRFQLFIFRQMLKSSRNPVTSFRELQRLKELRKTVQGNQKITKFIESDGLYYWVPDFPGFPSGNLKKLMQFEFQRNENSTDKLNQNHIPQQTIIWGITNRCMLQCSHCYDWDNIDSKEHLSLEQLKLILKKIENQGIRHVQLSGGEPLARFEDMISILYEASEKIDFWLLTSGYGLTEEKAVALKKAGLKGANISLDHWKNEDHNEFRNNQNSYEWALKAVANCRKAGILVSLSLCATREFVTAENLENYGKLAKNIGAHFIRILEPRKVGRFSDKKVHLDKKQIDLLSEFTIRLNSHPDFKDFPIVVFFGYHQRKIGCWGAGNRYLYIDANGDFHACPFCRGRKGNALTGSFNDSIERLKKDGCEIFHTLPLEQESV